MELQGQCDWITEVKEGAGLGSGTGRLRISLAWRQFRVTRGLQEEREQSDFAFYQEAERQREEGNGLTVAVGMGRSGQVQEVFKT